MGKEYPWFPEFCDHRLNGQEKPRLARQCRAIIDRLMHGRASNKELVFIALKYTGRISDARKSGFDIRCIAQDHDTGTAWYALFHDGKEVGA